MVQALAAAAVPGVEAEPLAGAGTDQMSARDMIERMLTAATPSAEAGVPVEQSATKDDIVKFAQRLGEAASANVLCDTLESGTAGSEQDVELDGEGRSIQHFLPPEQECIAEGLKTKRARDGKTVYRIRTRNVDRGTLTSGVPVHSAHGSSAGQQVVERSWSELQQLCNISTKLGDKKFRQAVPECKAPPAFPATYSWGRSTEPEKRLEELQKFFRAWNEWARKMRTEHGFVLTAVCCVCEILTPQQAGEEGSR
jgi:hypothetical protein